MSLLSWISGYDTENADRAAAADAELRALNERRAVTLGADWKAKVDANYATDAYLDQAGAERAIGEAFDEGWKDGQRNVSGFIGKSFGVVGDVFKSILFGIPIWVWVLGGLFLAWKLGLLEKLLRKARA